MAHHPGRALQESKNSPLAMAIKDCDLARLRELLDGGVDANTSVGAKTALHELCSTRDEATEPLIDEQQRAACVSALLGNSAHPNPGQTDESDESEPRVGAGPTIARNRPGPRH